MRSCSSSTASMKVKNVKKWADTHTHTRCRLSPPPLCIVLNWRFIASISVSSSTVSLFALHPPSNVSHTHTCEALWWAEDGVPTKLVSMCHVCRLCFTKGHFPKLAECAHFHYENVDFGSIQVKALMVFLKTLRHQMNRRCRHSCDEWNDRSRCVYFTGFNIWV